MSEIDDELLNEVMKHLDSEVSLGAMRMSVEFDPEQDEQHLQVAGTGNRYILSQPLNKTENKGSEDAHKKAVPSLKISRYKLPERLYMSCSSQTC